MQRDQDELTAQEVRLTELVDASTSLAGEVAERLRQTQALSETVARSDQSREELVTELARIQTRQREVVAQAEAAEDQLRRAESLYKALEQRRSQLAFSEKKMGTSRRAWPSSRRPRRRSTIACRRSPPMSR